MKIATTGASGMLGQDLRVCAQGAGYDVLPLTRAELDVSSPTLRADELPVCDWVINCAAYTRVDDAESDKASAYAINADGAGRLARCCAERGIRLIHLSTDYVFDGRKGSSYVETDPVSPLNVYGASKRAGELHVMESGADATIVRVQSLFGLNGRNFVKAILNQLRKGNRTLRVVDDQISAPTYTVHLAQALMALILRPSRGIFHLAAQGQCTWFDFARTIVRHTGLDAAVEPKSTAELNYPALRPAYSVLDSAKFSALTGHRMTSWEQGLSDYLKIEPLATAPF